MPDTIGDEKRSTSRRDFIKESSLILGGTLLAPSGFATRPAEPLKIALVGCGKRGAGAAAQALMADQNTKLVAMADVFRDLLDESYTALTKAPKIKDRVEVLEQNKFVGLDAYKSAIDLADVVLLCTPAPFRPDHFEYAIKAGKHVFMEKPVASDAPGIRKIIATGELAKSKKLSVVVGLQNRYDPHYQSLIAAIQKGVIGDILSITTYYMTGHVKNVARQPGQSELEYQLRNWRHFNWIWTGSPAGLQIHNDDIAHWVMGGYPVKAQGMGGRAVYKGPEHGDTFDHFFVEYEYANGCKLNSQIRNINGTFVKGGIEFIGSKGSGNLKDGLKDNKGNIVWKKSNEVHNAYQIEHDKFFASIRNGKPIADAEWGAKTTMTCILGRMAAHSGKEIRFDDAIASDLSYSTPTSWSSPPPAAPDQNGQYVVPEPGVTLL